MRLSLQCQPFSQFILIQYGRLMRPYLLIPSTTSSSSLVYTSRNQPGSIPFSSLGWRNKPPSENFSARANSLSFCVNGREGVLGGRYFDKSNQTKHPAFLSSKFYFSPILFNLIIYHQPEEGFNSRSLQIGNTMLPEKSGNKAVGFEYPILGILKVSCREFFIIQNGG